MQNGTPKLTTLENRMRLVTVPMPGVKSLTVLAMVGVGSRFENPKQAGISHFLEHLPFKGTQNYETAMDISSAIDGVGGKHNAFTGKEYTGYWVKVASSKWELALDMVSDLLLTARLREEDIEREKGVIVEEINMYEDNPQYKVSNVFDEVVYAHSGLGRDVAGFKETVTALSVADFRKHFEQWYWPENIVIGVVGDMSNFEPDLKDLSAVVSEQFSKGSAFEKQVEKEYEVPAQTAPRVQLISRETEQAHFHVGFPSIGRGDERRYVLSVLVTMLGGNSSSWMFNEIREKRGLAYYAYAAADVYHDMGSLYALEGVTTTKIEEALKATLEQFARAKDGSDITEAEVERAREYVTGKLTLDLESSSTMANLLVRKQLLEEKLFSIEDIVEQVRAVTVEDVRALADEVIDMSKLNLAVIGPYEDAGRFEELLKK